MKTIINFFKRAAKAYFREAAKTYSWMYTGCVYPLRSAEKDTTKK